MDNDIIYIDIEAGSKRVMNNLKLYAKLLIKFKEDPAFNELSAAFAAGDMEKARVANHALKGLSANLSLIELNKQSIILETQIKAGFAEPQRIELFNNVYAQTLIELEKVINQNV